MTVPLITSRLPVRKHEVADLKIDIVDNELELRALRDEWTELLAASKSDSLFLSWEWLHTWWVHFGIPRRLFFVTVRSGSLLVAVAPLTLTRTWIGPLAVPLLEFAGTGTIGSDYLDIIIRDGFESSALSALANLFSDTATSIQMPRVSGSSAAALLLRDQLHHRGWSCVEVPNEVCPFISFGTGSWDHYLNSVGSSHRYNFRRRLKNLSKRYEVRLRYADTDDDRQAALKQVIDLHLQRWQPRGGSDAFDTPHLVAFHEDLTRLARERGWLRLSVLELNGKVAAAFYCFRYGDRFLFYQSGFDPAFERDSVGLVMMGLSIRDAIAEGAREFDLLHGSETYKFLWARQVRQLVRLELYPPGRIGRAHRNATRATAATKRFAKKLLGAEQASLATGKVE